MPISIAQVLAQVESAGDLLAIRYEPAVFARYSAVDDQTQSPVGAKIRQFEALHRCTPDTARFLLSCSWGKYQIMGFNLNQNVLQLENDPEAQDLALQLFLHGIGVSDEQFSDASWLADPAALRFATLYNGPGNPEAYLEKLRSALVLLGG